jgi:hypothetical protein
MKRRGQILIIVAVLVPVALLLLAVAIDMGRMYQERGQMRRAAQSASDAGASALAEAIATLAFERYQEIQATPSPTPDPLATPSPTAEVTPTPPLDRAGAWLQDEDREALTQDPIRGRVLEVAEEFARLNGLDPEGADITEFEVRYPQLGFNPYDSSHGVLRLSVRARGRSLMLLAGLVGREYVEFTVEAASEVRVR